MPLQVIIQFPLPSKIITYGNVSNSLIIKQAPTIHFHSNSLSYILIIFQVN